MKDFILVLSIFALACLAAKTASERTDAERPASISTANGAIGDYVAAGLGISALKSTSTLIAKTRNDLPETTRSSSRFLTFPNKTATLTRVATSDDFSITVNVITTTQATDCWHSWQDYWEASWLNTPEYSLTFDVTTTRTETHTLFSYTSWITTSCQSTPGVDSFFKGSTIYSENYPVSVSQSYTIESYSALGCITYTPWARLGDPYYTTTTFDDGSNRHILVSPATALPTPSCELPSIVAECSTEWSLKIFDRWHAPAPFCTQAMITGDWCTALRSQYMETPKFIGPNDNVGWVTTGNASYFPASKTLAPGCTLGCQACSITGESVQLYYWPPTTATLVENGTETATLTPSSQNGSFVRTVSIDGTVLTSPTVYISYNVLHAADSCGAVGKTYRNTILPLSNTNHLFSVERLDPHGTWIRGTFATSSFNLMDLVEPIPDYIYNRQFRCKESRQDWDLSYHTPNATFSCARTESYAPIIEVPPEARALDPAWSSCRAWYGGLFDPPKALKPADASAMPTPVFPTTATSPAATPKTTSELPMKTSTLVRSNPRPQADQSGIEADPTPVVVGSNPAPQGDQSEHKADPKLVAVASNPRPQADESEHTASPAPVAPKSKAGQVAEVSASVSGDASRVGKTKATQLYSSEGVAAILSMFLTKDSQGADTDGAPQITPAPDPESLNDPDLPISVGSEVPASLAGQGKVGVDNTPLADAQAIVDDGQKISTMSRAVMADDFPELHSVLEQAPTSLGVFTVAGQEHTSFEHADDNSLTDGESSTMYSTLSFPVQPNAVLLAGHTLSQGGAPVIIDGQIVTYGPNGVSVSGSATSLTAAPTTDHPASAFTIDGTEYTVVPVPERTGVVVLQSHTSSISGYDVPVSDHLVTKGADRVSGVIAEGTPTSSENVESSSPTSTTDVVQSYSSGVQQISAAPSEPDESSASKHSPQFGLALLVVPLLLLGTLVVLRG